ncbi:MAG TPA: GNAT family N-acetyltransferase [Terriglobales bacterium]|nr:GNAT family N-acetyltransferase [Terriglobales bacterium]
MGVSLDSPTELTEYDIGRLLCTPFNAMITTPRLLLRPWRNDDREPFAQMCADPEVMEFLPACLTREQSDETVTRIQTHHEKHGFCLFAAELIGRAPFIGFVGLQHVPFEAAFTPAVEIGWRLARPYWDRGLATEGALAVLSYGLGTLELPEIVSFTVPGNIRSRRVMEKIGMKRDRSGDFEHPRLPAGHPLRRHVLYRLNRDAWKQVEGLD